MTGTESTLVLTRRSHPAGPILLRLDGELDHHTVPRFNRELADLPLSPDTAVILDLSGLEYCDSTGLTALVGAHHRAGTAGCRMGLVGLRPHVERVFVVTGLDRFLALHPTTERALDHLRQ
ncbi:STAS domain-containing protein [Streptomyces calidiresistens]|uniref:Anti-sigma factor antagonist n=1 Tax=Streptomyces calidiresistens TaxID=1485586 RepID=A0A7W3T1R7_9ACTN|nr:anti-sigma factor antagonist [Streptomyces calidiresistens]MBB0229349.1 anti-sigma factor antagonist [Streptomyces calidiresistens]